MKAFPTPAHGWSKASQGMDLRDYFAGQVISGILTTPSNPTATIQQATTLAYQVADAMMKART